ncbi:threonine/serine exporter family protein (plasmid) [Nicoliella spurrieriana]|uniref:Threonine/serine exporter family protein n=1 Tax=Nicoliella spurrieriana TaxID=2925830 RepID=A0A976RQV6_9LACO|nr:threonine/serine exporter family protein [Nicoliella spurrieriana]UQS86138.1 threonine/serine exporter family protein [Nicoliella spurrieriana]
MRTNDDEIANFCCRLGLTLLESGAEINRVETTVEFIGHKAGLADLQCYAELGVIFVYYERGIKNQIMKIKGHDFNFQKVDEINNLSRQFVENKITYSYLQREYYRIRSKVIDFTLRKKIFAAGLVSVAPLLLFHTNWLNLFFSFFVGILGYLATMVMTGRTKTPYLNVAVGGFVIGLLAMTINLLVSGTNDDMIIFSSLMPIVPGIALTNSFREIMAKNILSGLILGMDATMVAISISGGVIIGKLVVKMLIGGI